MMESEQKNKKALAEAFSAITQNHWDKFKDALNAIRPHMGQFHDNLEACGTIAYAAWVTNDAELCSRASKQCISLDPQSPTGYIRLGLLQLGTGQYGEAFDTLSKGQQHCPGDSQINAWHHLASHMVRGDRTVKFIFEGLEYLFELSSFNGQAMETALNHSMGTLTEAEELKIVKQFVSRCDIIVEVGALVGNHTMFFAKALKPRKIYVFDGNIASIEQIRKNITLNQIDSEKTQIILQHALVNNVCGNTIFFGRDVRSVCLDNEIKEKVDFLKIDVDGMEMGVLKGCHNILTRDRPKIMIEVDKRFEKDFNQFIKKYEYRVVHKIDRFSDVNYFISPNYQKKTNEKILQKIVYGMTKEDIEDIYERYVKINYTHDYVNRYNVLPIQYNNKDWKWEKKDFPRIISLLEFRRYSKKYDFTFQDVLCFNNYNDPEFAYIKCKNVHNINYEEDPIKNDLHSFKIKMKFDFIMINQTIEHLYNPYVCIKNIFDHLKDGGMFYANVPVINIPHSTPFHYYTGITPTGLGVMVKSCGFDILEIGQWGNKEYVHKLFDFGWIDYTQLKSTRNEIECPVTTWILAKKISSPIYQATETFALENNEKSDRFSHLIDQGKKYRTQGKILEATNCFLEVIKNSHIEDQKCDAYNNIAIIAYHMGDFVRTEKILKMALDIDPLNFQCITFLASVYITQSKYDGALDILKNVTSLNQKQ